MDSTESARVVQGPGTLLGARDTAGTGTSENPAFVGPQRKRRLDWYPRASPPSPRCLSPKVWGCMGWGSALSIPGKLQMWFLGKGSVA